MGKSSSRHRRFGLRRFLRFVLYRGRDIRFNNSRQNRRQSGQTQLQKLATPPQRSEPLGFALYNGILGYIANI
jgi:hypothetical protein